MSDVAVAPAGIEPRRPAVRTFQGAGLLSGATVASGVLAYAYHVLAARTLGPEAYGLVAVLWAALFLLVVVLFRPAEQTTSRAIADRLARGLGARSVLRAVAIVYGGLAGVLLVGAAVAWPLLRDRLFLGDSFFAASLVAALLAYGFAYVLRGICGGAGWYGGYALLLVTDGLVRVLACVPLLVVASRDLAAAAMVAAAVASVLVPVAAGRRALAPLRESGGGESFRCGAVVAFAWPAAVIAVADQVLVNGGPVLVMLGGGADVSSTAAVVFAATMLVRIPVFVFQGLATSLLPNLTRLQAGGDAEALRRAALRAAGLLAALAAVIVAAAAAAGPEAMQLVYGPEYGAGRLELALLAVGVGCYLAIATFSQALLALDAGRAAAACWCACAVTFVAVYALSGGGALFRVAVAFAAGTAVGVPLLARALDSRRRR